MITIDQVPRWFVSQNIGHVVLREGDGLTYTACAIIWGQGSQTERPKRICRKCRGYLKDLHPVAESEVQP